VTDTHLELSNRQNSQLLRGLDNFGFDQKLGIIALSLFFGFMSSAVSLCGTASDRVYFCVKSPSGETCVDENNKPLKMTTWHWQQWGREGRPKQVGAIKTEPATNPAKPLYAFGGFVGFAFAGWMLRHLQYGESQLQQLEAIAQNRDLALAEMQAMRELELVANDQAVLIQQAEILSQTEIELTKMDAEDAVFEAVTAGMTEQQRQQYIDFMRQQKTPYLQGSQTLQGIIDPKDKVGGGDPTEAMAETPAQSAIAPHWLDEAVTYCSVLIFGGMGSGKTTLAGHIIKAKQRNGEKIIVLDPHAAKGQWTGLEVVGAGMNYTDIDDRLGWYYSECERRYKILAEQGNDAVRRLGTICLVLEEFTNFASRCKNAVNYLQAAMSDNRKIYLTTLLISHNNTLPTLGGGKGIAQLRDDALLEIKLIPPTGSTPRQAFLKLPGGEFTPVVLPQMATVWDFGNDQGEQSTGTPKGDRETPTNRTIQPTPPLLDRSILEKNWGLEFNLTPPKPEPNEPIPEPLNHPQGNGSEEIETRFTPLNLTRKQATELINSLRKELNQTQLIEIIWQCKKGGSAAWRAAYLEFKNLMEGGE